MPRFPNAVAAWQSDTFARALKDEIESLAPGALPLSQGTSRGGMVDDSNVTAMVLTSAEKKDTLVADVGIFFTEILAACSCGDEPEEINSYCRLQIHINKASSEAKIRVLLD